MHFNSLTPLKWDSDFFGYDVAQIVLDNSGIDLLGSLINEVRSKGIRLTYLFVPSADIDINQKVVDSGAICVDQKVVFSKIPQAHKEIHNTIIEFRKNSPDDKLVKLALQAGKYSRFRLDKNFKNNEYERLYTQWLLNSVAKKIAFEVLVAVSEKEIVGLTTLGEKGNYADIGLVSVEESFSGRGIGTDLIHTADNIAFRLKYNQIKVVTQGENLNACKLYEKCNFKLESMTNVYHLWH